MRKYEMTDETMDIGGVVLHRIRAVRDFGYITAGTYGGWVEKESNLSHDGNAWVFREAKVYDDAVVCGNAMVSNRTEVFEGARVSENAKVFDNAMVYNSAQIYGNAEVSGSSEVCGNAKIFGHAKVYGKACVFGNVRVYDEAKVYDSAKVYGDTDIYGYAVVCGNANVCGDADVLSKNHVLVIGPIGRRSDFTTFYRGRDKQIMVKCGCFSGTVEKFLKKVEDTHGNNKHALVYKAAAELARLQIDL